MGGGGGGGGGGLIFETNCVFEYKPSPHFRPDVVYKMGGGGGGGGVGVLTGHYGTCCVRYEILSLPCAHVAEMIMSKDLL